MMRRNADIHDFKCDLLLKLLGFVSFISDFWKIIEVEKGRIKVLIHKCGRSSLAHNVMDIRDTQVHSTIVILSTLACKVLSLHAMKTIVERRFISTYS
jgi:hypothetical protein